MKFAPLAGLIATAAAQESATCHLIPFYACTIFDDHQCVDIHPGQTTETKEIFAGHLNELIRPIQDNCNATFAKEWLGYGTMKANCTDDAMRVWFFSSDDCSGRPEPVPANWGPAGSDVIKFNACNDYGQLSMVCEPGIGGDHVLY